MGPKRRLSQRQGYDQGVLNMDSGEEDPPTGSMELIPSPLAPIVVPATPFSFDKRRLKIDWRLLHGVDVERVVRPWEHVARRFCPGRLLVFAVHALGWPHADAMSV